MKPPAFSYFDPTTIAEAVTLLDSTANAKLLAGGQSLMPMLNMRFLLPEAIIDLNKIESLSFIERGNDFLRLGAMTRQRDIEFSSEIAIHCPIMIEAIEQVGHRQTRNRGTVGGSLCHLDPAAELATVAMVLDAVVTVAGPQGSREIGFREFPLAFMTPAIELNEIVTGVRLPIWGTAHGYAFIEFARRHGDFALASVAALMEVGAASRISKVAIALGGISSVPLRASEIEAALLGREVSDQLFKEVSSLCRGLDVVEDAQVPASYRRHLAEILSYKAMKLAATRATQVRPERSLS